MEVLIGGDALGALAEELLIAVLNAKQKTSSFRPIFERLQFTLANITRRLEEISYLNDYLGIQQQQHRLQELKVVLVNNGLTLVQKCSEVSRINFLKIKRYQDRLSELEDSLTTVLRLLDHSRNSLEILFRLHINVSVYHRKPMTKLFLLKGYPYDIDLADLNPLDLVSKGAHVTSYKCNAQYRDVYVKSINLEVPVSENEFQQRMEDIGKVGQHPNIMLPFGYLFSETARYLFYDYAPASSLYSLLKEPNSLGTRPHWDRRLKIILGAARGISHIHSQGGIIHGNIKSSNVLVTADYDGCISDFGLAPMMNIPELGAPELNETGEATQKSDVYNFGVMLSEIVNQYSPLWLYGWFVGLEQVKIRDIIGKCKDRDPDRRPKMDEVVRLIQVVLSEPSDQTKTMKKIVIKVSTDGPKSHSKAMKIAAGISGVETIDFQGEEDKNQLVVTGEGVDAVELTSLLRKNLGSAELISVSSVEEKKEGEKTQHFIEKCQGDEDDDFWIESTLQSRVQEARKLAGDTSKTNESGKSVAASLTQDTLGNESRESKDKRKSIEKSAFGLTEPPDASEWHDAESVKLGGNKLSNLPEEPMCPKLGTLSLEKNDKLKKIPPAFFTNMPLLRFLDLSETAIMSLPKSLFELPVLATLLLKNCKFLMKLPSEVGKLNRLEIFDMEGTEIINLPIEIKKLSLLRILRVSLYGCLDHDGKSSSQSNEMIPSGVISALSDLEELCIDVDPDNERWDACVERIFKEVCGLKKLTCLRFYFPRVELLSCLKPDHASMIYQSQFRLIVGSHSKRIISRLPSNVALELNTRYSCLKYINGKGLPEVVKKVLQNATTFHLDRHMTARKLTEFGIENMDSLEYCVLGECIEMQVIIDGNDVHNLTAKWLGFELLEVLYIYYMKNLKSIWEGPMHKRSLCRLRSLTLSTCPQLTTIFTVGLLKNLYRLEELTVRDCPAIKSLVSCEEGFYKQFDYYLPSLRTISLDYVPELVSISSEVWFAPGLREMSLYNCPKLKSLSNKEVSSKNLKKISGEKDWWEALELTQVQRNKFDRIFVSINSGTCF